MDKLSLPRRPSTLQLCSVVLPFLLSTTSFLASARHIQSIQVSVADPSSPLLSPLPPPPPTQPQAPGILLQHVTTAAQPERRSRELKHGGGGCGPEDKTEGLFISSLGCLPSSNVVYTASTFDCDSTCGDAGYVLCSSIYLGNDVTGNDAYECYGWQELSPGACVHDDSYPFSSHWWTSNYCAVPLPDPPVDYDPPVDEYDAPSPVDDDLPPVDEDDAPPPVDEGVTPPPVDDEGEINWEKWGTIWSVVGVVISCLSVPCCVGCWRKIVGASPAGDSAK